MVRVPTAENQVQQAGLPNQRFQAVDSGAGQIIAGAAKRVGGALNDVAGAMIEVEQAGAKQYDVEFSSAATDMLYNPDTGFMAQQGANALNGRKAAEEALDKKRGEILAKATPRQRMILEPILTDRANAVRATIGRHAVTEGRRYVEDMGNARIVAEQQNAIALRNDPEVLAKSLGTIEAEVQAWGARNGASAEQIDLRRREALGKAHAGIVDAIANDDPEKAQKWIDDHKNEILPGDADKLTDALKPAVMKVKAGRIADEVRGVAGSTIKNMARDDNLAARLAAVDKMGLKDPDLLDAVKREVRQGVALDQQMLQDQRARAGEAAWALVDQGKSVPPSLMAAVSPSQRRTLRNAMESDAEGKGGGFAAKRDPVAYNNALDMAAFEPDRFAKMDLNEVRPYFTAVEWGALKTQQRAILTGKNQTLPFSKVVSITRDLGEAAGLSTANKKGAAREKAAERLANLRDAVMKDVEGYIADNRQKPDEEWVRNAAGRQLTKMQVWDDSATFNRDEGSVLYFERGTVPKGRSVRYNPEDVPIPDSFRARYTEQWRRATGNKTGAPPEREIAADYLKIGNR